LELALLEARDKNVVVFAATSNEGTHERVAWPANDSGLAIGVHSCKDGGGQKSEFTAQPSDYGENFMVVGKGILSQRLTSNGGGFCKCEGSSFATPVAAAIGALVLAFTQQAVCYEDRKKADTVINHGKLYSISGMIKLLKAISTQPEYGSYWSLSTRMLWATYVGCNDPNEDEQQARQHAWGVIKTAPRH
jgi:hypothetical protein